MKQNPPAESPQPAISVVVICGLSRRTAKDMFASLDRQTCPDHTLEVVVWDLAPPSVPPPRLPARFATRYHRTTRTKGWWAMRHEAAGHASGRIIAFLEDHCVASEGWAAGLLEAWQSSPLVCAGYAFTNGSTPSWWSDSCLVSDYGRFLHPQAGGPAPFVAGNNVAYSREFLEAHADEFNAAGWCDFNLQEFARSRGLGMIVAPRAVVAHRCYETLADHLCAAFHFVRLLAAARARTHRWNPLSRCLRALAAPPLVPPLQVLRTTRLCWRDPARLRRFLRSLPLFYLTALAGALGECAGLLGGTYDSESAFVTAELDFVRI